MKKGKRLLSNNLIKTGTLSLLGTVLVRAVNLVSIPVFSRLLSTSEYGQVDVFMTFVNIFMILLGLDFHGIVSKGRLDHEEDADEYMTSNLLFTTLFSAGVVFLINIFFHYLQSLFGMDRFAVNMLLLYSYAMFVISYRSAEYNFYYEYKKNMIMSLTVALGNFILSVIFIETIFSNQKFEGRILGAAIPTICVAACVYFYLARRGRWTMRKSHVRYSLRFGVLLIPHNLSHLVLSSSDKVMINAMISASASGIYSLVYTLGMMVQVLSEAMNNVFVPWLFRQMKAENRKDIRYVQKYYLLIYCFVTIGVLVISPEVIKIIGSKAYWEGIPMVMWMVYAAFINFTYTLYVNVEFFYKQTGLISIGTIMAAAVNVILNLLFLRKFGYQFGAVSTLISYVALLVFHMVIVNFVLKERITDNGFVIKIVLLMLAITCVLDLFLDALGMRIFLGFLAEILIVIIAAVLYKKNGKPNFTLQK